MANAYDANNVAAAIRQLYTPGAHAAAVNEANAYLTAFAETNAAWEVALTLLEPAANVPADVQFFAANTMHHKIKTAWSTLQPEATQHVLNTISQRLPVIAAAPGGAVVAQRLCLALSLAAASSGPHDVNGVCMHALTLAANGAKSSTVNLALTLLVSLVDEVASLATSSSAAAAAAPDQASSSSSSSSAAAAAASPAMLPFQRPNHKALVERRDDVYACIHAVLTGNLLGANGTAPLEESLKCLAAWAVLEPRSTAGGMAARPDGLFQHALSTFHGTSDDAVTAAASEALVALVGTGVGTADGFGEPIAAPLPVDVNQERAAVHAIMAALVSKASSCVDNLDDEDACFAVARLACAAAERDAEAVVGVSGSEHSAALHLAMLRCASRPERNVCSAALEFFLQGCTVPTAQRMPEMQGPLQRQLVGVIIKQARYPAGFQGWASGAMTGATASMTDDRDAFNRFREQLLLDALDSCYTLLRADYLSIVWQAIQKAGSWQEVEACMFAVRVIAQSLKERCLNERETDAIKVQDKQHSNEFLHSVFQQIALDGAGALGSLSAAAAAQSPSSSPVVAAAPESPASPSSHVTTSSVFSSHPQVMEATAQLIGQYAQWLGQSRTVTADMFDGALGYLFKTMAMNHGPPRWKAAEAFRNLCARCSARMRTPEMLGKLMQAAEFCTSESAATQASATATASSPSSPGPPVGILKSLDEEEEKARTLLLVGLARVVSSMPDANAASACAQRLCSPILMRCHGIAVAATAASSTASRDASPVGAPRMAAELRLLAGCTQFLQSSVRGGAARSAPVASAALSDVWPVLQALCEDVRWRSDAAVFEAICSVYTNALKSCGTALHAALSPLCTAMSAAVEAHGHCAAFDVLAQVAEEFSVGAANGADATAQAITVSAIEEVSRSLHRAVPAALNQVQSHGVAGQQELLRALFEACHRSLLFMPKVIFDGGDASLASSVLSAAAAAISVVRESDGVRAALQFTSTLLSDLGKRANGMIAFVPSHGGALVSGLLRGAANTCPRNQMKQLANVLYMLFEGSPKDQVATWLQTSLSASDFPGSGADGWLHDQEKLAFCQLCMANLPREKFEVLVRYFFDVCRKEGRRESLVEMMSSSNGGGGSGGGGGGGGIAAPPSPVVAIF